MMKKKILIGSVFATLIIVSMPFISALGTTPVVQQPAAPSDSSSGPSALCNSLWATYQMCLKRQQFCQKIADRTGSSQWQTLADFYKYAAGRYLGWYNEFCGNGILTAVPFNDANQINYITSLVLSNELSQVDMIAVLPVISPSGSLPSSGGTPSNS